ncbi:cell division protein ZapA [Pasteuria penetrans]|uniref:cell division protein ZapA n=1 Tax=Pasteuria penetrans TaxID=86005 RepID=UPI00165A96E1|nr:cell division protein ZapA [Pasteuria penetrans]
MHNRLTITIHGQEYRITGDTSIDSMRKIGQYVDDTMCKVASNNPGLDATRLAVMTAINIAAEFLELKEKHEEIPASLDKEVP